MGWNAPMTLCSTDPVVISLFFVVFLLLLVLLGAFSILVL